MRQAIGYLVIIVSHHPAVGIKTEKKGWNKQPQNYDVQESPRVTFRLTKEIIQRASIIININERKIIKNSFDNIIEPDTLIEHFFTKYKTMLQGMNA